MLNPWCLWLIDHRLRYLVYAALVVAIPVNIAIWIVSGAYNECKNGIKDIPWVIKEIGRH